MLLTNLLTYLLGWLLTWLVTYLLTYLVTYLVGCLLGYLLGYLLTWLLTWLFTWLLTNLLGYLLTYLVTYLLTSLLTYLVTWLLTYLHAAQRECIVYINAVKGHATEWRRVDNATPLIDPEVAHIIDDMYSDVSGHVGATLRPLTQTVCALTWKNSMQTVPRLLVNLSKMYLGLDVSGAGPCKLYPDLGDESAWLCESCGHRRTLELSVMYLCDQ